MTTDAYIGRQVHLLMWDRHLTNRATAAQLGISESALSRKVRGGRPWTVDEVLDIAEALNVPLERLLPHRDSNTEPADYPLSTDRRCGYRMDARRRRDRAHRVDSDRGHPVAGCRAARRLPRTGA